MRRHEVSGGSEPRGSRRRSCSPERSVRGLISSIEVALVGAATLIEGEGVSFRRSERTAGREKAHGLEEIERAHV